MSTIDIHRKLLRALSKHPKGLTVTQASKLTVLNYMTASRHLAILHVAGKVNFIQIGMAKLYQLKRRGKR
jgi:DNA-binding IclR family transcriptional regulator